jgi:hypothetical protein
LSLVCVYFFGGTPVSTVETLVEETPKFSITPAKDYSVATVNPNITTTPLPIAVTPDASVQYMIVPTASPLATLTPTATTPIVATCFKTSVPEPIEKGNSVEQYRGQIIDYLNAGGTIANLEAELEALTWHSYALAVNLTGDKNHEVIVTVDFLVEGTSGQAIGHDSVVLVLQCLAGDYQIIYEKSGDELGLLHTRPIIIDIDKNGAFEVIIEWLWHGSASEMHPEMISWNDRPTIHTFERPAVEQRLCCPSNWQFDDLDGDGIKEIIVRGQTVGHPMTDLFPREVVLTYKLHDDRRFHIIAVEYLSE